ncbi:MAG: dienelactone hydrolase, partial [Acidimicrobiia bacterium]|nr:dienelactone hydrolase [Acidimicrobiia bacterium]
MPRATKPDRALMLTPGASAGRDQPALVAVEKALAPVPVDRIDFPYRRAGWKSPDKAPVLIAA